MKNVTITLPDDLALRVRVEAARQDKSVSRFIADLLAERCGPADEQLAALEEFLSGPGFPGASENWLGREDLYAEREDQLLRRHQHSGVRRRSRGTGQAVAHFGFAEEDGPAPDAGAKPSKPK
jgi:hypothetical protein